MNLGFRLLSGGLAAAAYTNAYIALKPCPATTCCPGRLYRFGDFGSNSGLTSGPIGLGYAFSCSRGGFRMPDTDSSGRTFPPLLGGKSVEIEVEGGLNPGFTLDYDVKISIYEFSNRRKATLYEDTFRIPVRSMFIGGIKVSGTCQAQDLNALNNQDVYESVLDHLHW